MGFDLNFPESMGVCAHICSAIRSDAAWGSKSPLMTGFYFHHLRRKHTRPYRVTCTATGSVEPFSTAMTRKARSPSTTNSANARSSWCSKPG